MAATYKNLARARAKRDTHRRSWRNIATGAAIVAVLIVFAVWGGGALSGIRTLKLQGMTPDGRPIYG